jgi:hypothetical protein
MFTNPSHYRGPEPDEFGFGVSGSDLRSSGEDNDNSPDEVIGEIGLVLIVVFGILVAVNAVLGALHIG